MEGAMSIPVGNYTSPHGFTGYTDDYSEITDVADQPGSFHAVDHKKWKTETMDPIDYECECANISAPYGAYTYFWPSSTVPYYMAQSGRDLFGHLLVPDGSAIALSRIPNTTKELMDGVNSLYELKDLRSTFAHIPLHFLWAAARGKRKKSIREFKLFLRDAKKHVESPLAFMKWIVGVDLEWKFGLKPLLKDINTVHSLLGSREGLIQRLCQQTFTRRGIFSDSNTDTVVLTSGAVFGSYLIGQTLSVEVIRKRLDTWVYGIVSRLDPARVPSLGDLDLAKLALVRDALGLRLDAKDVWEAVPYSFVLDWFLPIGRALGQVNSQSPSDSWFVKVGAWSSLKTREIHEYVETITQPTDSNIAVGLLKGDVRTRQYSYSRYTRTPLTSLPEGADVPIWIPRPQLPNEMGKWFTGIEMALQRIPQRLK